MKKGKLLWLATIFLSSIILLTNGCKKDETEQNTLSSFKEKSEYFEKIADIFSSTYGTSSFEEAVSLIVHEISSNNAINNSGLSEDSISIWWKTQDNVLFLLQLKVLDSYVDSLDSDFLGKSKVIDKSILTEVLPHNNKALLLSPSYYDWAPYAIPSTEERKDINYYFKQKLENKNFVVDYIRNETPQQQNISLDNYMNWDEYGIISFSGHGAFAGNIFGITSGIRITPAFEEQYSQKFLNNEFMWTGKAKDGSHKYVALTNIFFRNQYPNYLDNTFILMSACQSQKNSILSLDLVKIGGNSAYWGWTNNMTPLAGAWRNTRYLIDQMLDLGKTSGQSHSLMVQNNRHRHILLPQMKYTYLEMPPHSEQGFKLIESGGQVYNNFSITADVHEFNSNWDNIVLSEFGNDYRVADWNDLVSFYNSGGDLLGLFDALGLTEYNSSACVYRNGLQFYSSTRAYFASRHEHNRPPSYLAHENINNYLISLGSWYGARKIMVIKK
ncbi:MAG: hypothetical protein K0B10_15235 [Vicingaceae bacterium]|nr:hypothetical protein [Vicingaceae bacterium]